MGRVGAFGVCVVAVSLAALAQPSMATTVSTTGMPTDTTPYGSYASAGYSEGVHWDITAHVFLGGIRVWSPAGVSTLHDQTVNAYVSGVGPLVGSSTGDVLGDSVPVWSYLRFAAPVELYAGDVLTVMWETPDLLRLAQLEAGYATDWATNPCQVLGTYGSAAKPTIENGHAAVCDDSVVMVDPVLESDSHFAGSGGGTTTTTMPADPPVTVAPGTVVDPGDPEPNCDAGLFQNPIDAVSCWVEWAGHVISTVRTIIVTAANAVFDFFQPVLETVLDWLRTLRNAVTAVGETVDGAVNGMKDTIVSVLATVKDAIVTAVDSVAGPVVDVLVTVKDAVVNKLTDVKDGIISGVEGVTAGVASAFESALAYLVQPSPTTLAAIVAFPTEFSLPQQLLTMANMPTSFIAGVRTGMSGGCAVGGVWHIGGHEYSNCDILVPTEAAAASYAPVRTVIGVSMAALLVLAVWARLSHAMEV